MFITTQEDVYDCPKWYSLLLHVMFVTTPSKQNALLDWWRVNRWNNMLCDYGSIGTNLVVLKRTSVTLMNKCSSIYVPSPCKIKKEPGFQSGNINWEMCLWNTVPCQGYFNNKTLSIKVMFDVIKSLQSFHVEVGRWNCIFFKAGTCH